MAICSVSKCEKPAHARTWCWTHYQRWYKHGNPDTVLPGGHKKGFKPWWSRRGVENKWTLKSTISPSLQDIAWAAGFIEGEGSFTRRNRRGLSMSVSVGQVNKEPVQRLLGLFGGSLTVENRKPPNAPEFWRWQAHGARGRGVAMTVYPFLSAKRQEQVRHAL